MRELMNYTQPAHAYNIRYIRKGTTNTKMKQKKDETEEE